MEIKVGNCYKWVGGFLRRPLPVVIKDISNNMVGYSFYNSDLWTSVNCLYIDDFLKYYEYSEKLTNEYIIKNIIE